MTAANAPIATAHAARRTGAFIADSGTPATTDQPESSDRVKALYSGIPSRLTFWNAPSALAWSSAISLGRPGWPTNRSAPTLRAMVRPLRSKIATIQSAGNARSSNTRASVSGSNAMLRTYFDSPSRTTGTSTVTMRRRAMAPMKRSETLMRCVRMVSVMRLGLFRGSGVPRVIRVLTSC
jgi:hypothetical protein